MIKTGQKLSSFEVEALPTYCPNKIYKFFISSRIIFKWFIESFNIKEFTLKQKLEDRTIYESIYEANTESLSALELIKTEELYPDPGYW